MTCALTITFTAGPLHGSRRMIADQAFPAEFRLPVAPSMSTIVSEVTQAEVSARDEHVYRRGEQLRVDLCAYEYAGERSGDATRRGGEDARHVNVWWA